MTDNTDERGVSPFSIRAVWFLGLWYLSFQTALMDLSKRLAILAFGVLIGTALTVSAYAG